MEFDVLTRFIGMAKTNPKRDLAVEATEKIEQFIGREAVEMAVHETRDFRLPDSQHRGDFSLLEVFTLKNSIDTIAKLRSSETFVSVFEAQIVEDVARAFFKFNFAAVLICHACKFP